MLRPGRGGDSGARGFSGLIAAGGRSSGARRGRSAAKSDDIPPAMMKRHAGRRRSTAPYFLRKCPPAKAGDTESRPIQKYGPSDEKGLGRGDPIPGSGRRSPRRRNGTLNFARSTRRQYVCSFKALQ